MGFIDDPEQYEDFPEDPNDYESRGYQGLDAEARFIIEIFENSAIEIENDYVAQLIDDLISEGGINEFAQELSLNIDYFKPHYELESKEWRMTPFFSAEDAKAYLEGIPGWEGFAGLTWLNGDWYIWVGDTI